MKTFFVNFAILSLLLCTSAHAQRQDIRRGSGTGGGGGGATNGIQIQGGAGNNTTLTNPTFRGVVTTPLLTPGRVAMIGTSAELTNHPTVTTLLLDYTTNVTSDIQAQLNARATTTQLNTASNLLQTDINTRATTTQLNTASNTVRSAATTDLNASSNVLQGVTAGKISTQGGAGNANTLTNSTLQNAATVAGHLTVSSNSTVTGSQTVVNVQTNQSPAVFNSNFSGGDASITINNTNTGASPILFMEDWGAGFPIFWTKNQNGTVAAPSAQVAGDIIGELLMSGRGSGQQRSGLIMKLIALNNWTDADGRTLLNFDLGDDNSGLFGKTVLSLSPYASTNFSHFTVKSNSIVEVDSTVGRDLFVTRFSSFGNTLSANGGLITTGATIDSLLVNLNANLSDVLTVAGLVTPYAGFSSDSTNIIHALTLDASPSSGDFVMTEDLSTGLLKKTTISALTGGGEANTASSLGNGLHLFSDKSSADLRFNTLSNLNNTIQIYSNNNVLHLAATNIGSAQITDGTVSFADRTDIATDRLVGRDTGGTGPEEVLTVTGNLEFTGSGGIQRGALTGDVTASAGSGVTTIPINSIIDTKLADMVAFSVKGRSAGTSGDPGDITSSASGQVLRRTASDISFGALDLADTDAITGNLPLANGGTGKTLSDPGGHRLWGWDDTDNDIRFWSLQSSTLSYNASTDTLELDADLVDLADGSLTGSKVGTGIDAANVTVNQIALANGGTGKNLTDPNANKILGWDDTDNDVRFFTLGTGLSYDQSTDTLSSTGGSGSSNMVAAGIGTIDITNAVKQYTVRFNANTNIVLDWTKTNYVVAWPSNNFTVSFANAPEAGTPAQSFFLELVNTNATAAYFPCLGLNGTSVTMLSAPSTNTYMFRFDGTNTWCESGQILTTGSGDLFVFNNAPTIIAPVITNGMVLQPASGSVTVIQPAASSVAVTNLTGIVHKLSTSPVELNANASARFTITNRITAATTVVITNTSDGQEISFTMIGEASGGTSRTITLVPQLGHLVADLDTFGSALAVNSTFTLTNGNAAEVSWKVSRMNGTNIAAKVTRQFAF